jgi:uncharacterized metal-binding protein
MRNKDMEKSCADCAVVGCRAQGGLHPDFCPGRNLSQQQKEEVNNLYLHEEINKVTMAAAEVEGYFYGQMTRVEECMEFARRIGAKKIGLAICAGLMREGHIVASILRSNDFKVYGICCKVGALTKAELNVDANCIRYEGECICNPLMQAHLLNQQQTDLNIVVGLCVGHDSLFYKYSHALCTTLVTKDRVLGHNPAAALYTVKSYYKKLLQD